MYMNLKRKTNEIYVTNNEVIIYNPSMHMKWKYTIFLTLWRSFRHAMSSSVTMFVVTDRNEVKKCEFFISYVAMNFHQVTAISIEFLITYICMMYNKKSIEIIQFVIGFVVHKFLLINYFILLLWSRWKLSVSD